MAWPEPQSRFDRDTALVPLAGGRFAGRMDRGWWIERGPNGGYVAAIVLRALTMAVDDPARSPRSFTIHYLAPPAEGPVEVTTAIERSGRQLTFVGGRMLQGDRMVALAQAVFSRPVDAPEFAEASPPQVPPPEDLEPLAPTGPAAIPMRERYETRWAIGPLPFTAGDRAEAGGWIRLTDPRPADHLLMAALSDAWLPPAFSRAVERYGLPTIDLTVHFRTAALPADEWFLCRFRTRSSIEGFLEEDGEIWSREGRLLVQSRQLSLVMALPG
jgi:acyl-CoA thioesterase